MKNLIVYFSWSNNTKNLIETINKQFGFDVVRIERKKPYSQNYHTCAYVEAKEEVEKHIHPQINALNATVCREITVAICCKCSFLSNFYCVKLF